MLTAQQESYIIMARNNGSVRIYDYTSAFPLVQDGYLLRDGTNNYEFTPTAEGTALADELLLALPTTLDTEGDITLLTEAGSALLAEEGLADSVWAFSYYVCYPRLNSVDWCFMWEVLDAGTHVEEASNDAEKRVEQLFPGAYIGEPPTNGT